MAGAGCGEQGEILIPLAGEARNLAIEPVGVEGRPRRLRRRKVP